MNAVKILYWADFEKRYSKRLIKELEKRCEGCTVDLLEDIDNIAEDDYSLDGYDVVLLQSTDVTKFSAFEEERDAICEKLEDFVSCGKKLIVTHDVIYRRTRNVILQKMFNYQINNFYRKSVIQYHKTSYCKSVDAFASLPGSFALQDGEVCWGEGSQINDKKVFFEGTILNTAGEKTTVPLVFGKMYGDGQILWLNTGDTYEQPPQPVTELDNNYVNLLAESINTDISCLRNTASDGTRYLPYLHACNFDKPFFFICYCAANSARVFEICMMLDKLGLNYYLDVKNITSSAPGSDGWKDSVNAALGHTNCKSAFVMISEELLESNQCFYEIEKMNNMGSGFVPVLLGISLTPLKILDIVSGWSLLINEEKTGVFKNVLAIRKNSISNELEINQLIFNCHRDLSQFTNEQFISTINRSAACDVSIDINDIGALINQCKAVQ